MKTIEELMETRELVPVRVIRKQAERQAERHLDEIPENWEPEPIPRRWVVK